MKKVISILLTFILLFNVLFLYDNVIASEYTNNSTKLSIEDIVITNQGNLKLKDKFNIKFKLYNNADISLKEIKFSLDEKSINNFSLINTEEELQLEEIKSNESEFIDLKLAVNEKVVEGTYNIGLKAVYNNGSEETTQKFNFSINITDDTKTKSTIKSELDLQDNGIQLSGGGPTIPSKNENNNSKGESGGGGSSSTSKGGKPKLIIDNYSISPNPVRAGEEFALTISFFNTNKSKSVRNIKIMLNSSGSTTEVEGEGNAPTVSGSIFIPVGSSNTFFIDSIGSGRRVTKTIGLTSPYGVSPNIYELNVSIQYEDNEGNEYESVESIGINLFQEAKIQIGTISFGDPMVGGIIAGEDTPFAVDLYNTGRSPVYNFMIKINGDFEVDGDTLYIGTFQPGGTESFSSNIRALSEGDVKGSLLITYEDSTGKSHELTQDFSGTAINMEPEIDPNMPIDNDNASFFKSPKIIIGLLFVLIAIIMAVFLKKRKNKKNLDFNMDNDLEITLDELNKDIEKDIIDKENKDENN